MTTRTSSWGLLGFNQVDVNVSATELKNLVDNPVNLIGTPGSGKANFVVQVIARSLFGTIPFGNPGGGDATLNYDGPRMIAAADCGLEQLIVNPQNPAGNLISIGGGWDTGSTLDPVLISQVANHNILLGNFSTLSPRQNFVSGDGGLRLALLYVTINL